MWLATFIFLFICAHAGLFLLHNLLRTWIKGKYNHLSMGQCYRISTSCISGLQAVVVTVIATRTIRICNDVLYDRDPLIEQYMYLMAFYFGYDLIVMYKGFVNQLGEEKNGSFDANTLQNIALFLKHKFPIVLHHVILQCIGLPVITVFRRGLGTFFLAGFCLAEMSTPFYSIRNIMNTVGCRSGRLYELNGLLFVIAFFIGRITMLPYMYYRYAIYKNITLIETIFAIPFYCNLSSFLFFTLQLYWFILIGKTFFRYAGRKSRGRSV